MSGWKEGSDQYKQTQELFINIWRSLQDSGDKDFDGKISEAEWVSCSKIISVYYVIMTYYVSSHIIIVH